MKKRLMTLAIVLVACTCTAVNAQIQRGNVLIGADLANFNFGLNHGAATNINLTPKAAWFIKDNLALGAFVHFGLQTAKDAPTYTTYGVGPLARLYVNKINNTNITVLKHTLFFVEGNVGLEGTNISKGGGSTNGLGLGIGPGLAYFITPNIGLEGLLKYNGVVGFGSSTTSSALNLNIGFQIYLSGARVKAASKNQQNM
ncbi:hypothetical protein [Deminuibacter soli]|uniref:Outer membrane protein beta-barrel domain-containing protein n=1 Tax=Deminuibacter soli TaxID=2291815 RepID=A0A3E1NF62_9BACT|nr:hypothetical protein [Deminuibacter soli]RFM26517.1 hypothetical protein DXN05_20070 [Deminuibacter soli]